MERPDESRMTTTVAEGWLRGIHKSVVLPTRRLANVSELFLVALTVGGAMLLALVERGQGCC